MNWNMVPLAVADAEADAEADADAVSPNLHVYQSWATKLFCKKLKFYSSCFFPPCLFVGRADGKGSTKK